MWFTGQHLRIPNATFETWHRDYEGYSDRADIVRGAAAACDAKCASGNMNKTFGSALDWFEANWLPNARTQITAALAKIAAAASVNKGPAKKNAWDGLDPDDFGDPEPRR